MTRTLHALGLIFVLAAPASAQPAAPPQRTNDLTWIALGAGATVAVVLEDGMDVWPAIQTRVNLTSQIAVEAGADFQLRGRGLHGPYQLQMYFAPRPSDRRLTSFFTLGALGYFETRRVPERRSTLPTGDVVVYPAHRLSELSRPFGLLGGGGVRVRLTRRSSFESGAELWLAADGGAIVINSGVIVSLGPRR